MRRLLLFLGLFIFSAPSFLWATPTGLNNISTADVVPEKVLVFQAFTEIGEDNKPDYFTGFKYGPIKNLEIGIDGRIFPEAANEETTTFQAKYRVEFSDNFSLALGISNLGDRAKTGWENPYITATYDFNFLRLHLGGTAQRDNEGGFAGLDKTIKFFNRDFTLRGDLIETNDDHDVTLSAVFIYDLGYNFLLENWISFPTQSGKEDVVTLKLNYVINF